MEEYIFDIDNTIRVKIKEYHKLRKIENPTQGMTENSIWGIAMLSESQKASLLLPSHNKKSILLSANHATTFIQKSKNASMLYLALNISFTTGTSKYPSRWQAKHRSFVFL